MSFLKQIFLWLGMNRAFQDWTRDCERIRSSSPEQLNSECRLLLDKYGVLRQSALPESIEKLINALPDKWREYFETYDVLSVAADLTVLKGSDLYTLERNEELYLVIDRDEDHPQEVKAIQVRPQSDNREAVVDITLDGTFITKVERYLPSFNHFICFHCALLEDTIRITAYYEKGHKK